MSPSGASASRRGQAISVVETPVVSTSGFPCYEGAVSWEGLWRIQRELSEQARTEARHYRWWAWFWFLLWLATVSSYAAR